MKIKLNYKYKLFTIFFLLTNLVFISKLISQNSNQTFNKSAAPILFSGNATLTGQYSNRDLSSLFSPQKFWQLDLNPTLTVYGVPLSLSVLLSSQQTDIRQNINSGAVSVNVNTFQMQQDVQKQFIIQLQSIQELRALSRQMSFEALRDSLMRDNPNRLPDLARMRELDKIDLYRNLNQLEKTMGFDALRDSLEKNAPEKLADLASLIKNPNKIDNLENLQNGTPPQTLDDAKKMGLTQSSQDFFTSFPTFSVGAVYPSYSPLTVSGVALAGGNVEYNPGDFYMAITGGKALKEVPAGVVLDTSIKNGTIPQSSGISSSLDRELYMARIGYGKKEGGHFILSAIRAHDNQLPSDLRDSLVSISLDSTIANSLNPKDNYMLDLDACINIIPDILRFNGQATGSLLTQNAIAPTFNDENNNLKLLNGIIKLNSTSNLDFGISSNAIFTSKKTGSEALVELKYIGPGFYSLGSPNTRNDLFSYEAKARQNLMDDKMTIGLNFKNESDNLLNLKAVSTSTNSYGAEVNYSLGELVRLTANFLYNQQKNDNTFDTIKVNNRNTIINFNASTFYHLGGGVLGITNVTMMKNNTLSIDSSGLNDNLTFMLNQSISFPFQLAATTNFNISRSSFGFQPEQESISADFFITHKVFKIWTNSFGANYSKRNLIDSKTGLYFTTNVLINTWGNFNLKIDKNLFQDDVNQSRNFDEITVRSSFSVIW